jgi:hypothetical protein
MITQRNCKEGESVSQQISIFSELVADNFADGGTSANVEMAVEKVQGYNKLTNPVKELLNYFLKKITVLGIPNRVLVKRDNFQVKYLRVEFENEWWWVKGQDLFKKGNEKIDISEGC